MVGVISSSFWDKLDGFFAFMKFFTLLVDIVQIITLCGYFYVNSMLSMSKPSDYLLNLLLFTRLCSTAQKISSKLKILHLWSWKFVWLTFLKYFRGTIL